MIAVRSTPRSVLGMDRDFSPWHELWELLREERAYFLFPLVVGCGLCALVLLGAQAVGPLAPFIYPGW